MLQTIFSRDEVDSREQKDGNHGKPRSGPASSTTNKNVKPSKRRNCTLLDLRRGECGIIDRLDVPGEVARRLMELGFTPGSPVVASHSAPGGGPRVFQVDGSEIALRCETAVRLKLRQPADHPDRP